MNPVRLPRKMPGQGVDDYLEVLVAGIERLLSRPTAVQSVPSIAAIASASPLQPMVATVRVGAAAVGANRALMFDPTGTVVYADPMDPGFLFAGISQQAGAAGSSITVLQNGPMTEATWTWTPGLPLFVGANGTLTQTVPISGVMQEVAIAYTATMIVVQPQTPITLTP